MLSAPISRQKGQFQAFGTKFALKWVLVLEFQKFQSGFGISDLEALCAPISRENGQIWIFVPKFAQKWILELDFQKP